MVQVGRTGVLTPKAIVKAVRLAGTTVTNATLHNQDFISEKDIRIGDTVLVQKAGKSSGDCRCGHGKAARGDPPLPSARQCPVCGAPVARDEDGATSAVPARVSGPASAASGPFCLSRRDGYRGPGARGGGGPGERRDGQDSGGPLPSGRSGGGRAWSGWGKKSAENLLCAIGKSKENDLSRLLFAFGIRQVGQKAGKILAARFGSMDALLAAGRRISPSPISAASPKKPSGVASQPPGAHLISPLGTRGVNMESRETLRGDALAGKTFVLTGSLEQFTRDEAGAMIEAQGSGCPAQCPKTSCVVAGEDTPAPKLHKAEELGIPVLSETEFLQLLQNSHRIDKSRGLSQIQTARGFCLWNFTRTGLIWYQRENNPHGGRTVRQKE